MSSSTRYFTDNQNAALSVDAHEELLASLTRMNTHNPPVQTCSTGWKFHGLYSGPTSIAYLFFRLYKFYPDLNFKGQSLLDWAQAYLDLSEHIPKPDPDPNHCGIANETLAYVTVKAVILEDPSLAVKLCSYQSVINSRTTSGSNEWLYGRAGYLYFLRLARSRFDDGRHSSTNKLLTQTMKQTVQRILDEPQPWIWHGSRYLGAAHGVIGIICQVVLSEPETALALTYLLSYMLDQQYDSGNFPAVLPADSDKLVQFCHGGPGFVLSLRSLISYFPSMEAILDKAIYNAQRDVKARGLLTKTPGLCHGIAGNALSLESHEAMRQFLQHMTSTVMEKKGWLDDAGKSDSFVGLYTGEAGRAWTWAVLDKGLPMTCIGYNDL